uniref:Uncharacterized protein n=1 Tax=Anguilla anguilla TaxID=7936 RepID=A0A0E9TUR9_ANGAN
MSLKKLFQKRMCYFLCHTAWHAVCAHDHNNKENYDGCANFNLLITNTPSAHNHVLVSRYVIHM